MTQTCLTGLDLSYHAEGLPDRDTYLATAAECLNGSVPGDLIGWNDLDHYRTPVFWFNKAEAYQTCSALAEMIDEHPFVVHRRARPGAEPVQRISDCLSEGLLRSSGAYRDPFVATGRPYQLSITTTVNDPVTSGRCWTINRSTGDFTDADLRKAQSLQPVLALLDTIYSSTPPAGLGSAQLEEARQRARLTVRELDILSLVANGLSAHQIARLRRISARTVRKHLEHIYRKLDCHDRLLAVNKARQLKLLPLAHSQSDGPVKLGTSDVVRSLNAAGVELTDYGNAKPASPACRHTATTKHPVPPGVERLDPVPQQTACAVGHRRLVVYRQMMAILPG
jgi:DNA-binding CsgD family transcriptional regulator